MKYTTTLEFYPVEQSKPRIAPDSKTFSVSVLVVNDKGCAVAYYNHHLHEWILDDEAISYNSIIEVHGVVAWAYLPDLKIMSHE